MRILFSLVFFFALLYSIEGLECFDQGFLKSANAEDEEPRLIQICKDEVEKCYKTIFEDDSGIRGCLNENLDYENGCEKRRVPRMPGAKKKIKAMVCVCSSNRCNAASYILPSYTLWILTFVATTWCKYAFGYQ